MAKNGSPWGNFRPGRKRATFEHLVSPLGADSQETQNYSPSRTVTGSAPQHGSGRASQSPSAKDQRRGG